jgi:hypothetical protein
MWRAGGRYPVALVAALVAGMDWPRWPVALSACALAVVAYGAGRVGAGCVP